MVPVPFVLYAGPRSGCKDGVSTLVSAALVPQRDDRVQPGGPARRNTPKTSPMAPEKRKARGSAGGARPDGQLGFRLTPHALELLAPDALQRRVPPQEEDDASWHRQRDLL